MVPDVACLLGTPIIVKVDAEGITDLEPEEYKKRFTECYGMERNTLMPISSAS